MRIVFMGTPAFAVPSLDALARAGHELLCVVAQPDRPAGRGQA
ncbi:MAG TPA: methionyl-tRNA formyltransferase, partial [Anaeromyxobacteraceae bacterium]|nr:methionyl-tRNA formyltransferase [Anaeromyxobacteraceae bacterium]